MGGVRLQSTHAASTTHLTGTEDDAILVLVLQLFGVVQFLSADAQSHGPQLLICSKVVRVLCREKDR